MKIDNIEYRPLKFKNIEIRKYLISEYGNVLNINTNKHLTSSYTIDGRLYVCITNNHGKSYRCKIHNLVYESYYEQKPKGMTINHIDENYLNNHYTNLELCTHSENILKYIENNGPPTKIYPDEKIEELCKLLSKGEHFRDVAIISKTPALLTYGLIRYGWRESITFKYKPFPTSCTKNRRKYIEDFPKVECEKLILSSKFHTKEILSILGLKYNNRNLSAIRRIRDELNMKDIKYFDKVFIDTIDRLIENDKSNNEILTILSLRHDERLSFLLTRRRKKLGKPDFNDTGVSLGTQKKIMEDIINGLNNYQIMEKYNLERNDYTIPLMARLRVKVKKR